MTDFGIKVSRPGFDVKTATPNELAFSSKYKTLRVSTQGSGTLTNSVSIGTITHNLGYVPLFLVHSTFPPSLQIGGITSTDLGLAPLGDQNGILYAYADGTNLYVKAQSNFGHIIGTASNTNDFYNDFFGGVGGIIVGNSNGTFDNGAIRFRSVGVAQGATIDQATIHFHVWEKGTGSGNLRFDAYGINEDNTADFSGGAPFGRSQTTASIINGNIAIPAVPGDLLVNVTQEAQEIINRTGWVSGNAMGFNFYNNSSNNTDVWFHDSFGNGTAFIDIKPGTTLATYQYTIFLNQLA